MSIQSLASLSRQSLDPDHGIPPLSRLAMNKIIIPKNPNQKEQKQLDAVMMHQYINSNSVLGIASQHGSNEQERLTFLENLFSNYQHVITLQSTSLKEFDIDRIITAKSRCLIQTNSDYRQLENIAYVPKDCFAFFKEPDVVLHANNGNTANIKNEIYHKRVRQQDWEKSLYFAAHRGHAKTVQFLLFQKEFKLDSKALGEALKTAADLGKIEVVRVLLRHADYINAEDLSSATDIALKPEIVGLLLEQCSRFSQNLGTILINAIEWGSSLNVKLILRYSHFISSHMLGQALNAIARNRQFNSMACMLLEHADRIKASIAFRTAKHEENEALAEEILSYLDEMSTTEKREIFIECCYENYPKEVEFILSNCEHFEDETLTNGLNLAEEFGFTEITKKIKKILHRKVC